MACVGREALPVENHAPNSGVTQGNRAKPPSAERRGEIEMSIPRTLAALVVAATVFAACTASGGSSAASPLPAGQSPGSGGGGAGTVGTASSPSLGTYLTGTNAMTLYTHAGDSPSTSTCTGACATAWPPLTVTAGGRATAGTGVIGPLTTLVRTDGTTQVAYRGLPLYYWQGDAKPGDTTGDGVNGFVVAKVNGTAPAPSASGGKPVPSASVKPRY
jgi:predicted lipoprotein with Yx(FWY)xxD motif